MPAIRLRMVVSLRNVSESLALQVALGLGMEPLPNAMPRALAHPEAPKVAASASLSLTARPGERDPGLIFSATASTPSMRAFTKAVARYRHPERDACT